MSTEDELADSVPDHFLRWAGIPTGEQRELLTERLINEIRDDPVLAGQLRDLLAIKPVTKMRPPA